MTPERCPKCARPLDANDVCRYPACPNYLPPEIVGVIRPAGPLVFIPNPVPWQTTAPKPEAER